MKKKQSETVDLVFSFDTTGSMYPCLTQVRRVVEETTRTLFNQIPDLRIGIITHGDYCDGDDVITSLDLTSDVDQICRFVRNAPATSGGDADECYELVLNHARSFHWTSGRNKALVVIGDCNPHPKGYRYGSRINDLDWMNEAGLLREAGIQVYPVQALGRSGSYFYRELSKISGNPKLELPQFSDIVDIISAITFQRAGKLTQFEETLRGRVKKPSYHVMQTLDILAGRALSRRSVSIGSRFQVLDLPEEPKKSSIKGFVESQGLYFKKGRGFYQWTKTETIQDYKEVIAQNNTTGAILSGSSARRALGLPSETSRLKPDSESEYTGFIQSTSVNRALIGGTKFLYEIAEVADVKE